MRSKYENVPFPKGDTAIYWQYYFKLEKYNKELVEDIYARTPDLSFPVQMRYLHDYLDGYDFEYRAFDGSSLSRALSLEAKIDGCWDFIETSSGFLIFYNDGDSLKRQRFTQAHETFHVFQFFDPEFRIFIDQFSEYGTLPPHLIQRLIERSADQCASFFLAPEKQLLEQYAKSKSIFDLSEFFQVSAQSITYRLRNSGIYVPNMS